LKYCSWNLIFLDPVSIKLSINDACVCCIHTLLIQPFTLSNPFCTVIFVSTIFKTLRWSPWLSIPGFHLSRSISCSYITHFSVQNPLLQWCNITTECFSQTTVHVSVSFKTSWNIPKAQHDPFISLKLNQV
jgi:hypothetical protein